MGLDTGGQNKHGYGQELADVGKQKNPYTIRLHFFRKVTYCNVSYCNYRVMNDFQTLIVW